MPTSTPIDSASRLHLRQRASADLKRIGTALTDEHVTAVRGVLHGAMALYLTRYLNVPPARIPGDDGEQLDDLPTDVMTIRTALLDAVDRQRQVDLAARLVARHLKLGHPPEALIATLARALLREDAGFHAYQMLEAGVRQFTVWATPTRAGTSSLRSPAILRLIHRRNAPDAADGRHRAAPDAGRRAVSGGWGLVTLATPREG